MKYLTVVFLAINGFLLANIIHAQTCLPDAEKTKPDSRYILHRNGTVTDKETNLMWTTCFLMKSHQRHADKCQGEYLFFDTPAALTLIDNMQSFLGYSDWRIPSIAEALTLFEWSCVDPSINENVFPQQTAYAYDHALFPQKIPNAHVMLTSTPSLVNPLLYHGDTPPVITWFVIFDNPDLDFNHSYVPYVDFVGSPYYDKGVVRLVRDSR